MCRELGAVVVADAADEPDIEPAQQQPLPRKHNPRWRLDVIDKDEIETLRKIMSQDILRFRTIRHKHTLELALLLVIEYGPTAG